MPVFFFCFFFNNVLIIVHFIRTMETKIHKYATHCAGLLLYKKGIADLS